MAHAIPRNRIIQLGMLLSIAIVLIGAPAAHAQVIAAGVDAWETPAGATQQDFSADPLPGGFFGPGSLPWAGIIDFEGDPPDATMPVDTLITRMASADVQCGGPAVYVPIQMTSLNLKSTGPIIVDYEQGYSELWDVTAFASSLQSDGYAAFRKTCPSGGTFTSTLPVTPVIAFRRQMDDIVVTYTGDEIVFQSEPIGWVYTTTADTDGLSTPLRGTFFDADGDGIAETALATSNILVGYDMSPCDCAAPPADHYLRELNEEQARWARHGVRGPRWTH